MRKPDLLFLSHRLPYPPNKGEKIRAWHVLRRLSESHRIHLGTLTDNAEDQRHRGDLDEYCATIGCFRVHPDLQKARALVQLRRGQPLTVDFFHSRKLMNWVDQTMAHCAIKRVFVFSSGMGSYVSQYRECARVLDMVDVDSEKWRAYSFKHGWPLRSLYRREADALLCFERQLVSDFDLTFFVSEAEARRFVDLAPECRDRVQWLENGVDLETFSPAAAFESPYDDSAQHIVFTGTMDYWPNVDAVSYFVESVFPIVQQYRPAVQFHIVGANPSRTVLQLGKTAGVDVTGRVKDVRPFLAHADVAVAPLRIARGIQNKVLEAMAMGCPTVLTSDALEGIHALPGRDLLLGDAPEEMATAIVEILEGRHTGLGASARKAVERHHCWVHTLAGLDCLFQSSCTKAAEPGAEMPQNISVAADQ